MNDKKTWLGAYVDVALDRQVRVAAALTGVSKSQFLREAAREHVARIAPQVERVVGAAPPAQQGGA